MSQYDKIYDLVTRPVAESFVRLFPRGSIHPNTVTWTGFLCSLIGTGILLNNPPNDYDRWQWLLMALTLFVYNITDAMDGLIARREGVQSCEGEVLDHMIDAVATIAPMSLGWVSGSVPRFTHRFLLGQFVFLESHVYHRIAGGRLIQSIGGIGVDACELFAASLCLIWAFNPTGLLGRFIEEFFVNGIDYIIYVAFLFFTLKMVITLFEKRCWSECFDSDWLSYIFFTITTYYYLPLWHSHSTEVGTHVLALAFTMPLYFFRTLYKRLRSTDHTVFASRHEALFQIVGHVLSMLLLLHILTLLPVVALQQRREILWYLQAVIGGACCMATLWTIHIKGPDLKNVEQ